MIYGKTGSEGINESLKNPNELLEMYVIDEVSKLPDEKIKEFCESKEAETMIQEGIISRKTLVRLSKNDDLSRRTKMAAFQLAKENNDSLWDQLVKNRIKEKQLIAKIVQKYGNKATKAAKVGQQQFMKRKLPLSFMRSGGNLR